MLSIQKDRHIPLLIEFDKALNFRPRKSDSGSFDPLVVPKNPVGKA